MISPPINRALCSLTLDQLWSDEVSISPSSRNTLPASRRTFRYRLRRKVLSSHGTEVLEIRQLLTGPPLAQPGTVDEAFSMITDYSSQKVVLFDTIKTQLLGRPLESTPALMANQLQNTATVINSVLSTVGG